MNSHSRSRDIRRRSNLTRGGEEVELVAAVTLAVAGGSKLSVAGLQMLGHLFEGLLQDVLRAFPDPGPR